MVILRSPGSTYVLIQRAIKYPHVVKLRNQPDFHFSFIGLTSTSLRVGVIIASQGVNCFVDYQLVQSGTRAALRFPRRTFNHARSCDHIMCRRGGDGSGHFTSRDRKHNKSVVKKTERTDSNNLRPRAVRWPICRSKLTTIAREVVHD